MSVLIVDDEAHNRSVLEQELELLGHASASASDGLEALSMARANGTDLVLLDVMMPGLDGIEVLRRLKADSQLRHLPVVMISALDDVSTISRCIELGAEDYLPKPFDPVLLKARVQACLQKKRMHDMELEYQATIQRQTEMLRGFLPPQVAELLTSGRGEVLDVHRRDVTIVFCDLRGFTSFSETTEPEEVMQVLADYHAGLGPLIRKHDGMLERFIGDGIMVMFNDPLPCGDHPHHAVRMALDMRDCVAEMAARWRRQGHELGFGMGIARGYATLGRIGFEGRFHYTAIGTVANLSARLCNEAKDGQILIDPKMQLAVEGIANLALVGELPLKGLHRPVPTYNVVSLK